MIKRIILLMLISTSVYGADVHFADLPQKTSPAGSDIMLIEDATSTKYITFTNLVLGVESVMGISGISDSTSTTSSSTAASSTAVKSAYDLANSKVTMAYPVAGVPNSTGSAWGTSYTVGTSANNLVQLNGSAQLPAISAALLTNFPTLNQNTTGTAANLSGTPILPNGTAATTQNQADNSTKLATTSYVDTGLSGKQATLAYPVTGVVSPTPGYLVKWGASGNTLVDGLKIGTMTDTKYCIYTAANGLVCNSDVSGGSMVYPGVGVPVSTGSAWGTSLNITAISDSTSTTSSTTAASAAAVKSAYDLANAKQTSDVDLTSLAGGITGIVKGAGNGNGYSAATAGTDYGISVEIDAHTAQSPTVAQLAKCNGTTVHNYNQAASNVNITLPTAAANLAFLATVSTARSNYWRFTAASAGTIYLNGSVTGKDYVQYATPAQGNYFSCFTANQGGAYVWYCTDGVGSLGTN